MRDERTGTRRYRSRSETSGRAAGAAPAAGAGSVDRAYAERLDVDALARSAWVSPSYFRRSFKAAFGETPHQYLTSRRLERAKALLRAGDLSVTEVCHAVGFSSLGSFSSQFRRVVGESPSAYRRRVDHADLARVPACYVRMWTHRASDRVSLEKPHRAPPP